MPSRISFGVIGKNLMCGHACNCKYIFLKRLNEIFNILDPEDDCSEEGTSMPGALSAATDIIDRARDKVLDALNELSKPKPVYNINNGVKTHPNACGNCFEQRGRDETSILSDGPDAITIRVNAAREEGRREAIAEMQKCGHCDVERRCNDTLRFAPTRNEIINGLLNGIKTVYFTKLDGENRVMRCTLMPSLLPLGYRNSGVPTGDTIAVWDVDNFGWRSFRVKNVISIA